MSHRCSAIVVAAALLLTGLVIGQNPPTKDAKPPNVTVIHPIERKVADYTRFLGRIEAAQRVDLRPRVTGYVDRVNFQAGTMVNKGDILFELDPRPYQAALAQAKAELLAAEAQLKERTAAYDRTKQALGRGASRPEEVDAAEAAVLLARANMQTARAHVDAAALQRSYADVRAPITGRIDRPHLTPGNLARADTTSLATIVSLDPLYVTFDIDQHTYQDLFAKDGTAKAALERQLLVRFPNSKAVYRTKVNFTNNHFDPNTATLHVGALLPNPKHELLPGMAAQVYLRVSEPQAALLVPLEAIHQRLIVGVVGWVLVLNKDHRVADREITFGSVHGRFREIEKGLSRTDLVLVKTPDHVVAGMIVTPQLQAEPAETSDSLLPDSDD